MSEVGDESFDNLHARALILMGRYEAMASIMDWVVSTVLHSRVPQLGQALMEGKLRRIPDEERLQYFVAAADDVGYSGDLSNARPIYDRAMQARDLVAHCGHIEAARHEGSVPHVGFVLYEETNLDLLPDPFVPSSFERLGNDCGWLSDHAVRVIYEAGLAATSDLTGSTDEPPRPGALPDAGEPLT